MTSPTVLNLRLAHPSARITYLTKEAFAPLVREFEGVDDVVTIRNNESLWGYYRALTRLDQTNFDTVVDLHGNPRSWLARKLIAANRSIVYPKRRPERRDLIRRHGKRFPVTESHTIDAYNSAITQLGLPVWADRPVLKGGGSDLMVARVTIDRPIVAIAPGASYVTKQFGVDRFVKIATRLQQDYGAHILWLATAKERLSPTALNELDRSHLIELIAKPLTQVAAELSRADVAVANDSGIAHLASAVGTPVVAVFGPTHPALGFAPRGLHDRIVQTNEFCRPCSLHGAKQCYREEQFCFTKIDPDSVVAEVAELLAMRKACQPAVFVDRDGTVIKEKHFLKDPDQVELESGAASALREAKAKGYRIVVISNQSGVARGLITIDQVEAVSGRMLELLCTEHVEVDGVYYCPYHADGSVSEFTGFTRDRKPGPGMVETAAEDMNLDLRRSAVIGDRASDLHLAAVIGCAGVLVRTGYGREAEKKLSLWEQKRFAVYDGIANAVASLSKRG